MKKTAPIILGLIFSTFVIHSAQASKLDDEYAKRWYQRRAKEQKIAEVQQNAMNFSQAESVLGVRVKGVERRGNICKLEDGSYEGTAISITDNPNFYSLLAKTVDGKICDIGFCPNQSPVVDCL